MRFVVQGFVAALLMCSGLASAAVSIDLKEALVGNSAINVAPGGTFNVDVMVVESGEGTGISGVQLSLDVQGPAPHVISVVGPADIGSSSAAINTVEWDNDISANGVGLPLISGPLPAVPYGSGYVANGGKLQGSSRLMTIQVGVDPSAPHGSYQLSASGLAFPDFATGTEDVLLTSGASLDVIVGSPQLCTRTVVARNVFYNGSFYGGAIATDKVALLPGQTASRGTVAGTNGQPNSSNVISYSRSLNGLYVDVQPGAGCDPLSGPIAAANFDFAVLGRSLSGAPQPVVAPTSITATAGSGVGGSDRITVIWADNAIPTTNWVRITVKASLGLVADDVHYWGVAIGDGMNDAGNSCLVNATDQGGPKPPNTHNVVNRALITDVWDFNKDGLVNATDQGIPKAPNATNVATALQVGVVAP